MSNVNKELEVFESKIQQKYDIFKQNLDGYNSKISDLDIQQGGNIVHIKKNIFTLKSFRNTIPLFIIILACVMGILYKSKPKFICYKATNEKTHFTEWNISIINYICYSICITLGLVIAVQLSIYIYSLRQ